MPQELPKAYDPTAIEDRWAEFWVKENLFNVATPADSGAKPFSILLPPPNVTGRLHMGHMLNQTEMDILTRWHRMRGGAAAGEIPAALWLPGTDHAGIATQMMVERQLAGEGSSRQALGREAFVERVWEWKRHYGGAILDQMKRLGASVDWSREYFTMDDRLNVAVREAFVRLHEQGLIYRGAYIVNWDPVLQTAVSDLEVESEERVGKLYHVRYPLADGKGSITIATTRPETMLGDVAVAVNPADERYRHLIGKMLTLPLVGREIPVIADEWSNPEFGTGAVKVTPAHDPNDFAIGKRHNLPNLTIMDKAAKIDVPGGSNFNGLDRFKAREAIVAELEKIGLLVAVKDHAMTVPVSQRSGSVIEPRLSDQWFIAVNKQPVGGGLSMAEAAIAVVKADADGKKAIHFTPEMYEKTYLEWMNNIHDWCISRQLWWGHRIPAWHCDGCKEIVVARTEPSACTKCGGEKLTQDPDVLDTWFSSGLLPFTVFGWPTSDRKPNADMAAFYPTSLLVTGFDILFFWVARMIMLGCHFMMDVAMPDGAKRELKDAVPFREVYIHALVRDADRQKMSKTKGNVIDPIEIVKQYGTDAVRFTLASMASPGTDIAFSEARTEGYRAFANKIWNAARFLFMNMERAAAEGGTVALHKYDARLELPDGARLEDRWIVTRLSQTAEAVNAALEAYRYDEAAALVYQFFWGEMCDWYLEIAKLRLNFATAEERAEGMAALGVLVQVFDAALRMLSPFMPFMTEEIYDALWAEAKPAKSIALTRFPQAQDFAADGGSVAAMKTVQELITTVRALRKELGVPEKEFVPVQIFAANRVVAILDDNATTLAKLARVSGMNFVSEALTGTNARSTAEFDVAVEYEKQIDVAAERERLTKEIAKFEKGLTAAEKQLGNEAFLAKAPDAVVAGLKKQQAETRMLYDKAKAALESLPQ